MKAMCELDPKIYAPEVCEERRRRIRLSVAAYAYEVMNDPIMSDAEFDKLSLEINVAISTGNDIMDEFFRTEFSPHTGQWIWKHPNRFRLGGIYYWEYQLQKKPSHERQQTAAKTEGQPSGIPKSSESPKSLAGFFKK